MRLPALSLTLLTVAAACGGDGSGPTFADDHPRVYLADNLERLTTSYEGGSAAAARFKEIVDIQVGGQDIYDFQMWYAALIGHIVDDPSYCEFAVGRVDAFVAAEEELIGNGERPVVASGNYLEIGARVGDVLLVYDWCHEQASDSQKSRWLDYAAKAIWNVWHPEEASWGGTPYPWTGWSIDNPSNNFYYSFLRATMLFGLVAHGEHDEAEPYLDFFRDTKIQNQLVPTFESDLEGGGSREGTGYGVAMQRLWEVYDFWEGSTGEDLDRLTGHARASMLWMLHSIMPTRDRIALIGDHSRDASGTLFDYHRNYLLQLAYLYRDDPQAAHVAWFLENCSVLEMDTPFMYVYDFLYEPQVEPAPMTEMGTAYYGPGTGQLFARSSWETDATWINFIAGPYTESHAHRDQGSFTIFSGGEWQAYDPLSQSDDGIRGEEELHNIVRITEDGATLRQWEQTVSEMSAINRGDGWLHAAGDLTAAYRDTPSIQRVQREIVYIEPDTLVVFDRVDTSGTTTQIWQLSTPTQPTLSAGGATAGDLEVVRLLPDDGEVSIYDWTTYPEGMDGGFRLDVTMPGGSNLYLHVLSVDGAVTGAVRDDAEGRIGAAITLADGRTATVRFSDDGVDGTLEISDGGGTVVDEALGEGIDELPE
jgi:hypothetical protein